MENKDMLPPDRAGLVDVAQGIVEANIVAGDIDDDTATITTSGLIGDIADALAALSQPVATPPAQAEWQPIETAPKDGTRILVSFGSRGVHAVSWNDPYEGIATMNTGIWCVDDGKTGPHPLRRYSDEGPTAPTYWMSLPATPQDGQEGA